MYKGDLFLPYFFYVNFQRTLAFFGFMCYNIITLKEGDKQNGKNSKLVDELWVQ